MEPERPIEKLLRAFAKKRRDDAGAPLELHPADRRLLQGEVARQTREQTGGSSFFRFFASRRLAFTLSAIAITGIGVWLLAPAFKEPGLTGSPDSSVREMTQLDQPATTQPATPEKEGPPADPTFAKLNDETKQRTQRMAASSETSDVEGRALPATSAVAGGGGGGAQGAGQAAVANGAIEIAAASERATREPAGASSRWDIRSTNAPTTEEQLLAANGSSLLKKAGTGANAAAADALAFSDAVGQARLEQEPAGGIAATTGLTQSKTENPSLQPLPAAAPPPSQETYTATLDLRKITNSPAIFGAWTTPPQRFVQVSFGSSLQRKDASDSHAVLASFEVQRNGRQIQVVDEDGSVYSGEGTWSDASVRNEPAPARTRRLPDSEDKTTAATVPERLQDFVFSVSGTNARLKQPIAFTGRWTVLTNAASFGRQNQTLFLEADTAKALASVTNPPTQILGTVTIGNSNSNSTMMMRDIQAVPVGR